MRRLAIPEVAAVLGLHPSEVRTLIEEGRLDAIEGQGRWLISTESVHRLARGPRSARDEKAEPDVRELEARVAELERRLDALEGPNDPGRGGSLRPALQPLFRPSE